MQNGYYKCEDACYRYIYTFNKEKGVEFKGVVMNKGIVATDDVIRQDYLYYTS